MCIVRKTDLQRTTEEGLRNVKSVWKVTFRKGSVRFWDRVLVQGSYGYKSEKSRESCDITLTNEKI